MNRNHLSRNHFDLLWSITFHDSDHESLILFLNRQKLPKKYQNKNENFKIFNFVFEIN